MNIVNLFAYKQNSNLEIIFLIYNVNYLFKNNKNSKSFNYL